MEECDHLNNRLRTDEEENLWIKRPDLKRLSGAIGRIARQAEATHKAKGLRKDTYFYKVVLGGNIGAVKKTVQLLEANGQRHVVDWLLKRGHHHQNIKRTNKYLTRVIQGVMFCIISVIFLLLTPLFYGFHTLTTAFTGRQKKRISANIHLPLAFAAFSKKKAILEYFLSLGIDIEQTDGQANNVFHYIADLSSESSERAIEIFTGMVQFINDADSVRDLMVQRRNSAGLTAVEYAAKFGSPALLTYMLNHPNLLQKTVFAVGDDLVCFNDEEEEVLNDEVEQEIAEAPTKLELIDVSMYEAGSINNQSTLLNLLSDRDVATMTLADLALFDKTAFVGKWITYKIKQMIIGVLVLQFADAFVTALLMFVLGAGHVSSPFQAAESQAELRVMLREIESLRHNESHIFKPKNFEQILEAVRYDTQLEYLPTKIADDGYKQLLYDTAIGYFPKIKTYYNNSIDNMDFSRERTPAWIADRLYDVTISLDEFETDWPLFYVWRYLPKVIYQYTSEMYVRHPHLFADKIDISNRELVEIEVKDFFTNFTIMVGDYKIQPSKSFGFWDFHNVFCVQKKFFGQNDMKNEHAIPPPGEIYHTSCDYKVLLNMANRDCQQVSPLHVYEKVLAFLVDDDSNKYLSIIVDKCYDIIVILSCLYISLDFLERLVFLYTCVFDQSSAWQMVLSVLSRKVPGSYARKQINLITYFFFLACFIIMYSDAKIAQILNLSHDQVHELGTYLLIIGLVFRFVMHIHAMRLLPGIGHFVITTFMMGTNLLHFSAVFGIVVFIFSILFHILIDDPLCPVEKYEGFRSLIESIFATFKLTFGHGDFTPYWTSTPVKLTYTLYVVVVGLLLMNLIIAIMSTTATEIMTDPWKETLWRVEWLDEATSVEYTFNVLGLMIRKCCTLGYCTHKRAGFFVKKVDGVYKVYIEVFHCPALE